MTKRLSIDNIPVFDRGRLPDTFVDDTNPEEDDTVYETITGYDEEGIAILHPKFNQKEFIHG